ncbi:MAG: 4Fe-4S binding protein [Bacteroidetes bacterium]|nr:4Fe-4S binding protein [Bacteroidota bacterium]MCL1968809.1 4Fe-4S binding protein [Bacteroidota bacterium]
MLDSRNNYRKKLGWIATGAVCAITATACLSDTYNTQSIIGLCVAFLLLCIIGLSFKTTTIQHFRPLILLCSLVYFGFIAGGCNCILFYFQGFILFLMGKSAFWLSFTVIMVILILSVIFGSIWCGWLCWLGALQEFIFRQNKWRLLKTKKAQKILIYIQTLLFVSLVIWVVISQRPVLCAYDPFVAIFKLKIFNWMGYITVPLLIISSLFIYRPFCRIFCPIGWLLYIIKFIPFAAKLKLVGCTDCRKCHSYCKTDAIHDREVEKTCILCGECKRANCSFI